MLVPNGVHDATNDEVKIRRWWTRWPDANIGVAGGDGVLMIDIDTKAGKDGMASLAALEAEYGPLPSTLRVATANGGYHLYFTHSPELEFDNSAGTALGQGLDVRSKNGYVVAPPSTLGHGKDYTLASDSGQEPAEAPQWLLDLLQRAQAEKPPVDLQEILNGVDEGQRDIALFRGICKIRAAGIGIDFAYRWAEEAAEQASPPFSLEEARAKVARLYRKYGKNYPQTDMGNAERMVDMFGDAIRWVDTMGQWLIWNGRFWEPDDMRKIEAMAKEVSRGMIAQAAELNDEQDRNNLLSWARYSQSHNRLKAMIELVKSEPGIGTRREQFNRHDWLLPVMNGVLDLRSWNLVSHAPSYYFTKCVEYEYDPEARCPRWLEFQKMVTGGNVELQDYLQRVVGYALTGSNAEKAFFFAFGGSNTGKSVYARALADLLGPFAMRVESQTLMVNKRDASSHSEDIAQMDGARFVYATEGARDQRLNEGLIKTMTGDDIIRARVLRENSFQFKVRAKIWYASNHKPVVTGSDDAIWNRIKPIPFEVVIPDLLPKEKQLNRDQVRAELLPEMPGILNWALEGLEKYLADGLSMPKIMEGVISEYRQEMDTVGQFIDEGCHKDPSCLTTVMGMYRGYREWCGENGVYPLRKTNLNQELKDKGYVTHENRNGIVWIGLGLREQPRGGGKEGGDFMSKAEGLEDSQGEGEGA